MQKIHFHFNDRKPGLRNRKKLKIFIEDLFINEKKKLEALSYIFCSDEYLLDINKTFLKHDFYTDIITFDLGDTQNEISGEIYISVDRVKENARQLGVGIEEELHRVIFHGALHLCGYRDKSKGEVLEMRKKEDKYLRKYFNSFT
jgi:rRNA maturation RNase YbeY